MKNLKKILALVLAFACAFTMFAGAAFTDQADINADNADAVELLTTLNIISGYPDGTFDPEGTVDRAEMAKMIYTIRNGGNDDASAHVDNTTSFTDINGHWAEGYIKYLQNTGIVAGKSATTFDPDSPVTTTEAMKMALALAGYDEKNAELTGPNWSKNTLTLATTIGLTDNVSSAMNAGCTRQDAAQILANVLEATAVRYSAIVEDFVNDSKDGLAFAGNPISVGYKWMDLTIIVGQMISSGDLEINNVGAAGKDRFKVAAETVNGVDVDRWADWGDAEIDNDYVLTVKDGEDHTDLVGQEVKLLVGDKIDEVYGVYATATSQVVETTMDQISVENGGDDLKVDGASYDTEDARVYVDLEAGSTTVSDVFGADGRVAADNVKMIDYANDGDYETILVTTVTAAKVNSVTDSALTVGATGSRDPEIFGNTRTIDLEDNTVASDIAKGDYAAITMNDYDGSWIVEKIATVEGTVNGLVKNERKIRVDGEWYTLANSKEGTPHETYVVPGGRDTFTNGDQIIMYTIGTTVYFADSTTGNDANRSVLMAYDSKIDAGLWHDTAQVKVILANGDKKTVDIDDINDIPVTEDPNNAEKIDNLVVGQMYRYTIDNDGDYSLYTLSDADATARAGYDLYVSNENGRVNGSKIADYMIADDAVVFALIGNNDAAVYSGKTIKNANSNGWANIPNGGVLVEDTNGIDYARMFNIVLGHELNEANNYAVLLSDAVRSQDDAQYIEYHLWNGSEVIDVREKTDEYRENYLLDGDVIAYENDGTGMIKSVEKVNGVTGTEAAIRGYANGDIRLMLANGTDEAYEVNGDTTVIYFNTNNDGDARGVTGDGYDYTATPVDDVDGAYYGNAIYVLDNDGTTIEFILIDINGNLYGNVMNNIREVNGDVSAAELQRLLNTYAKVVVNGSLKLDGDIIVPNYTELEVNGGLDLNHNNMTVEPYGVATVDGLFWIHSTFSGTITVGSLKIGNTGVVESGSKIIIAKTGQDLSSTTIDLTNVAVGVEIVDADNTVYTVATNEETGSKELTTETGETPEQPGGDDQQPGGDVVVDAELAPAEVDSADDTQINVPWHGAATSNAEVLAKIQADLPDLNITAVKLSSAGHTATAADGTEYTVKIKDVYLITVTDANGKSYSAYSDWENSNKVTMTDVPDGSYIVESADDLSPSSGSINVNTTDKYNTKPFTLTAAKDAAYVQAVKIVSDSNTTVKIGDHEVEGNDYVKVGSALTLTGAKGTTSFTQITLNAEVVATSDYNKDASYKCTASLDLVKDDAITFATKQNLYKVSVDGTLLEGLFDLANDAINLDKSYADKKLMAIKTASGSVSLHLFDDGTALLTPTTTTVDVEGGVAEVAQIAKNKVTSAKAEDGVAKLVTVSEITGDTTTNIARVDVLYNDVVENIETLTDWSTKKLYVPTGASVQVTSADAGLTVGHILKAVVGDEVLDTATVAAADKAISIEFTAENGITVSLKAAS